MKKKILLLSTFIIVAIAVLCTGNKKEVKAEEENCETYYNYYLFLDGSNQDNMLNLKGNNSELSRTTGKWFKLGVPVGAKNINGGPVTLNVNDSLTNNSTCGKTEWNLEQFYNIFETTYLSSGEEAYSNKLKPESVAGGINEDCSYARAYKWIENGKEETGSQTAPENYESFKEWIPSGLGHPNFNETNNSAPDIGLTGISDESYFTISRTWSTAEIENTNVDPTLKIVLSPAAYYVSYELCEEVTPEKTYTLTVEHIDDATNEKIDDDYVDPKEYSTGEEYEHSCKDIDGYTVINSSNQPSKHTGKFEDKNITKQCYYTKNEEKTYLLTINFGDDETCKNTIADSVTYENLKAGDVQTHKIESSIGKLNNPKLGNVSEQFTTKPTLKNNVLSATMPAKNVEVCIVYMPETGASWIYLAWVIGGLALGYSIWYFVRYYKKQNSEV